MLASLINTFPGFLPQKSWTCTTLQPLATEASQRGRWKANEAVLGESPLELLGRRRKGRRLETQSKAVQCQLPVWTTVSTTACELVRH